MPPMVYPPIRVSEQWISPKVRKENPPAEEIFLAPEGEPVLDWLEPENSLLPSSEPSNLDAMEGIDQPSNQKFPDVIFVAKFDPPIVLPSNPAVHIYNSTNASLMHQPSTFDGLIFPPGPEDKINPCEGRKIKQDVTIPIFSKNGEKSTRVHKNTLLMEKIDYGLTLTELPFSHPRQLVEMLPTLRQYSFLSTILSKSFPPPQPLPAKADLRLQKKNKNEEFDTFMSESSASTELKIDISLTTQPIPRLCVVFPFKERTANITFDVKLNGVVEVVSQNLISEVVDDDAVGGEDGVNRLNVSDLGTMLEITEDLGIWIEFVKRRLG
jgi:hypothetical protein